MMRDLSVSRDFSEFPFGRYPEHGPFNGQRFRDEFIKPALEQDEPVTVDLTGARGLAPSFLEECFGGLIRAGFSENRLRQLLTIRSDNDPSYIDEIWDYVHDAALATAH